MAKWIIRRTSRYRRSFKRLSPRQRELVRRAEWELANADDPRILGHPLKGRWRGCYSYVVTRNLRIIYSVSFRELILWLIEVGTHKVYR